MEPVTSSTRGAELSPTAYVVGVDLGGTQIRAALVQGGAMLTRIGKPTLEQEGPEAVIKRMQEAIRECVKVAGITLAQVEAIGIGAPGPLDGEKGIVFSPPNLTGWDTIPLQRIMEDAFRLPARIGNDANLAGFAEFLIGAGRGTKHLVYITVSTGIGGGVISNGRILTGVSGTAGEIGHMTIDSNGPRCNCGNIGCLEVLASGRAIGRYGCKAVEQGTETRLRDLCQGDPSRVDSKMVVEAAREGDTVAAEIMHRAATLIGVGVVNVLHLYNPEIVVIGGGVMQAGELLFSPIRQVVGERAMRVPAAAKIVPAALGQDAGILGAAALAVYDVLGKTWPGLPA